MEERQRRCREVCAPLMGSPCGTGLLTKLDEDAPADKVRTVQTREAYGR